MGHSNGKISSPISLHADVYPVLGLTKTGTYYDTGYICSNAHGRINPWAKYKPTIYNSPDGGSDWWKANDGRCGLVPKLAGSLTDIPQAYMDSKDGMNGWVYNAPVPGRNWCRIADFNGYNHASTPPYSGFSGMGSVGLTMQSFSFSAMMEVPEGRTDMLNFGDINFPASEMYFGVYIDGEREAWKTADAAGTTDVEFSTVGFVHGDYTAYPFLSSVKMAQGSVLPSGSFYTIPGLQPFSFEVVGSLLTIFCQANKSITGNGVQYSVSVTSNMGNVTLTDNIIRLRYSGKGLWDAMTAGEQEQSIPDVTVTGGTTTRIATGVFRNVADDLFNDCVVWVSLGTGRYTTSIAPAESVNPGI